MSDWFVYIIQCEDGTLYTGITTDTDRRLAEHQAGTASKYTRAHGAEKIVYTEAAEDRSKASKREAEIKQFTRKEKEDIIKTA